MAFPSVTALTEQVTASGTSHAIDLPATVAPGDLLVLLVRGLVTLDAPPATWEEKYNQDGGASMRIAGYAHVCDGSEDGGTVTLTTGSAGALRTFLYHVAAASWYKNLAGVEDGTPATAASGDPNPPTLAPSWGAADTLWLVHMGTSATAGVTLNSYPSSYTDGDDNGMLAFTARRELNTASENPGVLDLSGSSGVYVAQTIGIRPAITATATITGTATASIGEADVVAGGKTIIITLAGDSWLAAGALFNAQRQAIIDGLDSAQAEGTGWNAEVRDNEVVGAAVRTSDSVVTITLSAAASYNITALETITVTVPASAVVGGGAITGSPTFNVNIPGGALTKVMQYSN
jgi:hypothetical protein